MALAQYIAGMGFSNVGLGVGHAMAHPLSAFYDTPHGVACAILLPAIMDFNKVKSGTKYREIARAMGVKDVDSMSQEDYREAAINAVRQLSIDVGIPQNLKGIVKRKILIFYQKVLLTMLVSRNPRKCGKDVIKEIYKL